MTRLGLVLFPLVAGVAVLPLPAAAQRRADLAPAGATAPEPILVREAGREPGPPVLAPGPVTAMGERLAPSAPEERPALEASRLSTGGSMAAGAAVGVALGIAVTFVQPGCSSRKDRAWSDNLCSLALIGYTLNGAWIGAGVGYLIDRHR